MDTEVIRISDIDTDKDSIERAGQIIKAGGLVAFPTETVYGLGGNGLSSLASSKIYAAKGRPSDNPLILHIASTEQLIPLVKNIPEKAEKLMDAFWPGPMTLIMNKSGIVPKETTGGLDTVAIRMPAHPVALALIRAAGLPIAAPSANSSGRPSPTCAGHVYEDLSGKIDMILDGGDVGIGLESTIIDVTGDVPTILRPGYINQEMLEELLGRVDVDKASMSKMAPDVHPKAPGMKYRHYAPKASLTIVSGDTDSTVKKINSLVEEAEKEGKKAGIICTSETMKLYTGGLKKCIGAREAEGEIAHNLYGILREFDTTDVDVIYSEAFNGGSLGQAIMNRLLKAAGHQVIDAGTKEKKVPRLKKKLEKKNLLKKNTEDARETGQELTEEDIFEYDTQESGDIGFTIGESRRVIFVCSDNTCAGNMAEAIFKSILGEHDIDVCSRGLVVLFPEPVNPKAVAVLKSRNIVMDKTESESLSFKDLEGHPLILTMTQSQKSKLIENYPGAADVFTLREFVGSSGDIELPVGGSLADYGAFYEHMDLLTKMAAEKIFKEVH